MVKGSRFNFCKNVHKIIILRQFKKIFLKDVSAKFKFNLQMESNDINEKNANTLSSRSPAAVSAVVNAASSFS